MRLAICAVLAVCGFSFRLQAQQREAPAVSVSTVAAERRPIAKTLGFVGRVEAVNRVEIRARVTGFLEAVLFKEGDLIKEGDPLYRIEKGLFQAAVEQAQGALGAQQGGEDAHRASSSSAPRTCWQANAGTAVARDQALAADEQAKGAILTDEANLQTAKINLGYTDITAPIAGKIGRTNVTKGNVVGPRQRRR